MLLLLVLHFCFRFSFLCVPISTSVCCTVYFIFKISWRIYFFLTVFFVYLFANALTREQGKNKEKNQREWALTSDADLAFFELGLANLKYLYCEKNFWPELKNALFARFFFNSVWQYYLMFLWQCRFVSQCGSSF